MANSLVLAYHNLSIMLDAGVPLLRSLNTVSSGLDPHTRVAFLDWPSPLRKVIPWQRQ